MSRNIIYFQVSLNFGRLVLKRIATISIVFILLLHMSMLKAQPTSHTTDSSEELTDTAFSLRSVDHLEQTRLLLKKDRIDSLIQCSYSYLGNRYKRGGTTKKGFDCSGFTMTVFKQFRIILPHTSAGQGLIGMEINRKNINKGDLVLFKGRNRRSKRIGHVGIVISEKGEPVRFIHSSTSEGVRIDHLDYDYYHKRFLKAVRPSELYR